jgi:ABC-2 type transport system permease protein
MNASAASTPPSEQPPSTTRTLRHLFLTLFLRGRTARGLQKQKAARSIGQKLAGTLALYALFGLFAIFFQRLPVFAFSAYLHAMTFSFLAMFVASSAGEVLFNKEEADILLHRPISPRELLWAKIAVLVEVSLWLGIAFNLAGFFTGCALADGGWRYPPAHLLSVGLEALFCAGSVVMVYELCLRWFGRERLEGLLTTAQVLMSVVAVVGSQLLPRLLFRADKAVDFNSAAWWLALFPPAWFAGLDDAMAGSGQKSSWLLALIAVVATAGVSWLAFAKLAESYGSGLQRIAQTAPTRIRRRGGRRWIEVLADLPPLRWWLRDPVSRASFLLTAAYLVRDRDVKLRIYPAVAPFMAMPLIFLLGPSGRGMRSMDGFGVAIAGCYVCLVPMMAIGMLRYSQQWQAADIFRCAPLESPAALRQGARGAVLCLLAVPLVFANALLCLAIQRDLSQLLLLLPGVIAMPVLALAPSLDGGGVPLVSPTEEAKGAGRGFSVMGFSMISFVLAALGWGAWESGWFWWFILAETAIAVAIYTAIGRTLAKVRWRATD